MQILKYEKVLSEFIPWSSAYLSVAQKLIQFIQTEGVEVIHIGSTSAMIGGKGIIDLSALYNVGQFEFTIEMLKFLGFQDQISETPFPPERPRKDGAVIVDGEKYLTHIHVIERGSVEHHKQIKYKEHMLANPSLRAEYELSKKAILAKGITDQEAYGKLKSPFVKSVLSGL